MSGWWPPWTPATQQPELSPLLASSQVMKIAPWCRKPREAMTRGIQLCSHASATPSLPLCMLWSSVGTM